MTTLILGIFLIILEGLLINSFRISVEKRNRIFAILVFFQLFLPAGLRNFIVYNDSPTYAEHFENVHALGVFDINPFERFEYGYQVLENFTFLNINNNYSYLFIITSFFIQMSYVIFFCKYSKVLWFSVFLYIGFTHYFFVVSGIRQGLAIAVYNFALIFLFQKRWFIYTLLTLLAASFHSSAYILLLVPLINFVKLSKKTFYIFIIIMFLSYFFLDNILELFFSFFPNYGIDYMEKERISESKTGVILILITYLIGFIFVLNKFDFKKNDYRLNMMFIFYVMLIMFLFLSIKISILVRFTHYFIPLSIVFLSNIIYSINDYMKRFIAFLFWIIILIYQIVIILTYRPEWFNVLPYKFYWE